MLKSVFLKALRLVVLGLLLFNIAVSGAFAQAAQSQNTGSPQPPEAGSSSEVQPTRAERIQDRERITPSRNRSQQEATPSRRAEEARPKDPYEDYYDAMKKFNEEVYGKGDQRAHLNRNLRFHLKAPSHKGFRKMLSLG
ncbi:MAG: hypothetical protein F6K19_35380 [Cyanothece sp. SIO1E1]|nr:hypothetical protein [Cyanothece sp. SIO1E1]